MQSQRETWCSSELQHKQKHLQKTKKKRHRNISPPGDSQWHLLHGMLFSMLICLPVRMMEREMRGKTEPILPNDKSLILQHQSNRHQFGHHMWRCGNTCHTSRSLLFSWSAFKRYMMEEEWFPGQGKERGRKKAQAGIMKSTACSSSHSQRPCCCCCNMRDIQIHQGNTHHNGLSQAHTW